jgi:hypothetical protein
MRGGAQIDLFDRQDRDDQTGADALTTPFR